MRTASALSLLAVQVVGVEMMRQMRIAAGIPALIDPVDDTRKLAPATLGFHQPMQSRALAFGGDFRRIGRADGGDMAGVEAARLEKRDPAVELHPIDVESGVRDAKRMALAGVEIALVGDVVDGQHGGDVGAVPAHVGWRQPARPVVGVDDVRGPAQTAPPGGDVGRGEGQAGETQVVILPVGALGRAIGGSASIEQRRRGDQIQDHAVGQARVSDAGARNAGSPGKVAGPVDVRAAWR